MFSRCSISLKNRCTKLTLSMFERFLDRMLSWSFIRRLDDWRQDLAFYWFTWDKTNLAFIFVLGGFFAMLGGIVYFAYSDNARVTAERQRRADLDCLARNVYHEARGEPLAGQRAVAEVTLNRVGSPQFPNTVCTVVYEKRWDHKRDRYIGAFSWTELDSTPRPKGVALQQALAAARTVYDHEEPPLVQDALFYHANYIAPQWAKEKNQVATIGRHIFYE